MSHPAFSSFRLESCLCHMVRDVKQSMSKAPVVTCHVTCIYNMKLATSAVHEMSCWFLSTCRSCKMHVQGEINELEL